MSGVPLKLITEQRSEKAGQDFTVASLRVEAAEGSALSNLHGLTLFDSFMDSTFDTGKHLAE